MTRPQLDDLTAPREEDLRPSWGLKQIVILIGAAAGLFVLLSVVLVVLESAIDGLELDTDSIAGFVVLLLATAVLELFIVAIAFMLADRPVAKTLRVFWFQLPGWRGLWPGGAALIACYLVLVLYGMLIEVLDWEALRPEDQIENESNAALVVFGVFAVLFAPVIEELLFRGFLFRGLIPRLGVFGAALASGLLFGAVHQQLGLLLPFTLVGMILAWSYWFSASIWVPIATHLAFNSISTTVQIVDRLT